MPASKTHLHLVIRLLNISLNSFILYSCNEKECSRKNFKWNKNRNPYTSTCLYVYILIDPNNATFGYMLSLKETVEKREKCYLCKSNYTNWIE